MTEKSVCSFAFVDAIRSGNYFEAFEHAQEMIEVYGDVLRHHEMMMTVALRREQIAAALEHCNEIISYGALKGQDIAEFEEHRAALLLRLANTRTMLASVFWDEVMRDTKGAPARYATIPLIIAGEAYREESPETGGQFLVFYQGTGQGDTHSVKQGGRIACKLAECEAPFIKDTGFPQRVTVHGRFLSVSESMVLLFPCHFLGVFETPWQ